MRLMHRHRAPYPSSQLQPDYRFVRTIQAPHHLVPDKATGLYRLSSKAFGPSKLDGGLSGDLEELLARDGLGALAFYPAVKRAVGAATLSIKQIRGHGLEVRHEPVMEDWYHGGIHGFKGKAKEKLFRDAVELIAIDQNQARLWFEEQELLSLSAPDNFRS